MSTIAVERTRPEKWIVTEKDFDKKKKPYPNHTLVLVSLFEEGKFNHEAAHITRFEKMTKAPFSIQSNQYLMVKDKHDLTTNELLGSHTRIYGKDIINLVKETLEDNPYHRFNGIGITVRPNPDSDPYDWDKHDFFIIEPKVYLSLEPFRYPMPAKGDKPQVDFALMRQLLRNYVPDTGCETISIKKQKL